MQESGGAGSHRFATAVDGRHSYDLCGALGRKLAAEPEARAARDQEIDDHHIWRALGEGVLDMIPGGAALKNQVAGANTEQEVKKMEAIILSMTKRERAHPELIDGARKKRIARGSGVEPSDVNKVLKARDAMQKLAKQFGAVNRKGKAVGPPRLFGKGGAGW